MNPHRFVWNVFKVIGLSIVLVFVLDMVFYLYKAVNLNQRVETVCSSMQKVIMENNFIPANEKQVFDGLFDQAQTQMNGGGTDNFFLSYAWNYNTTPSSTPTITVGGENIVEGDLDTAGKMGHVKYLRVEIRVRPPFWNIGLRQSQTEKLDKNVSTNDLTWVYDYLVPCLKYQVIR